MSPLLAPPAVRPTAQRDLDMNTTMHKLDEAAACDSRRPHKGGAFHGWRQGRSVNARHFAAPSSLQQNSAAKRARGADAMSSSSSGPSQPDSSNGISNSVSNPNSGAASRSSDSGSPPNDAMPNAVSFSTSNSPERDIAGDNKDCAAVDGGGQVDDSVKSQGRAAASSTANAPGARLCCVQPLTEAVLQAAVYLQPRWT